MYCMFKFTYMENIFNKYQIAIDRLITELNPMKSRNRKCFKIIIKLFHFINFNKVLIF